MIANVSTYEREKGKGEKAERKSDRTEAIGRGAGSKRRGRPMTLEAVLSVAMLGCFIWVVRYLLPKAIKQHDRMAVACVVLTAVLALVLWLLIGVSTRSSF